MEINVNVKGLLEVGICADGVIKYGEAGEAECVSYARIWFVNDYAVIAEPYSVNEKGEFWFYDREVDFSIVDVFVPE